MWPPDISFTNVEEKQIQIGDLQQIERILNFIRSKKHSIKGKKRRRE